MKIHEFQFWFYICDFSCAVLGLTYASASILVLLARYSPLIVLVPVASLNSGNHQITVVYCTLDTSFHKAMREGINGSKCFFLHIVPKCELHFIHYHFKHSYTLYSNIKLNFEIHFIKAAQDKCFFLSHNASQAIVGSNLTWIWVKFHVKTTGSLSTPQLLVTTIIAKYHCDKTICLHFQGYCLMNL